MKNNIHFPPRATYETHLQKYIGFIHKPGYVEYSEGYKQLLQAKLTAAGEETVDDMISGSETASLDHQADCSFTSLRKIVHQCLDMDSSLSVELARDCGHRLDDMDAEIEQKILANRLTCSEYIRFKRSFNVIRIILFIINDRLEKEESDHPLRLQTKLSLQKIVQMTGKVNQHLDDMLESVNREKLKADPTAWLAGAVALVFATVYISSFFALDKEHSAADQIYYFLGIR